MGIQMTPAPRPVNITIVPSIIPVEWKMKKSLTGGVNAENRVKMAVIYRASKTNQVTRYWVRKENLNFDLEELFLFFFVIYIIFFI